jgi:hypothetical protein
MTSPEPRSKYRKKVRDEMVTAYLRILTDVEADAVVDYIWPHSGSEPRFDELLVLFVATQRTWWGTLTLRLG